MRATELLAAVAAIPAPDLSDPAVAELAEQFALDVAGVDETQRSAFLAATGDRAFAVIQQIYAADLVPRVRSLLAALGLADVEPAETPSTPDVEPVETPSTPDVEPAETPSTPDVEPVETPSTPDVEPVETPSPPLDTWPLLETFMAAVARLDALDPRLTELVRLRGARLHDCALCKSRRSADALDAGATESDFAAVDAWPASSLDARSKAALGLVDAMILSPFAVPADVVAAARTHLREEETIEVVLDVMRNAANKIAVALGADAANVTDGTELFRTDADGNVLVVAGSEA